LSKTVKESLKFTKYGSKVEINEKDSTITKKECGWNSLVKLDKNLTNIHNFKIIIESKCTGMFIGIGNTDDINTTGYMETCGI